MRSRSMRVLFSIAVVVLAAGQLSAIGPAHYYVSNAGAGAACTLVAPCATWAAAITAATNGDEISALTDGDFGPISLGAGKGVLIDGGGHEAGVFAGTVVVNVDVGESVTLRGLDLNGTSLSAATSIGMRFTSGLSLTVEDCKIQNYGKRGISIESLVDGAKVFISNTTVSGQANNGISVIPPSVTNIVALDHVRVVNNGNSGVGVAAGGTVEIRDSVLSNNVKWGLLVTGTNVSVENTSLSGNLIGIQAGTGSVRLSNVNVWNNSTGLFVATGGTITSFGNNSLHGNTINGPDPTPLSLQ